MANFDLRIQDYTGISDSLLSGFQTQMDDFMVEGAKKVINSLPNSLLYKCADTTRLNNSTPSLDNMDNRGKILNVLRLDADSSAIERPCRYVDSFKRGRIQDSSDMELATATDPAYLIYDNVLEVYPTPTASQTADVHLVLFPSSIDASSVGVISNFPDEAEDLVVIYASIKIIDELMAELLPLTNVQGALTNMELYAQNNDAEISAMFGSEASARLAYNNQKYQMYEKRQIKLQQDYDRGIASLAN